MEKLNPNIFSSLFPFPFIINALKNPGALLSLSFLCKTCNFEDCIKFSLCGDYDSVKTCARNLNFVRLQTRNFGPVVVFGVILEQKLSNIPRKHHRVLENHLVKFSAIRDSLNKLDRVFDDINSKLETEKASFNLLHDIKPSASLIFRNAEKLIGQSSGSDFYEKFENSSEAVKALYKSVVLMENRMAMANIYANPESASFGALSSTGIFRLLHMLVRTFSSLADAKKLTLRMDGRSFNTPNIYSSFLAIPFVLIDNAIKYSLKEQEIVVSANDLNSGKVEIIVKSFSPHIKASDQAKIFEKGFRCESSQHLSDRGAGLGLYIAKIVAEAHNTKINLITTTPSPPINGISYCHNSFTLVI